MATIEVVLTRDEIHKEIAYGLICMTRYGAAWDTMRRKRRWVAEFTEAERKAAYKLFPKSHIWFCGRGVPDTVRMTFATYHLWQKLAAFCGSL